MATGSIANDSPSRGPGQEESKLQDVSNSKQNEVPGKTISTDEVELPTVKKKLKPDTFKEWCQKVRDFEQIKDENKLDALKKEVLQAEEELESLQEGYSIESRLQETKMATDTLKKRLNIPNINSDNVQTNISVSQESVLQKFEEMYAQWIQKWSNTNRESDLCKIHEECDNFCKKRFELQMQELLEVAKPQSKNKSYNGNEKQIIQEAYKELARNNVGTELAKIKVEGSKTIKTDKERKKFVPECLEICWITLILKETMSFDFNSQQEGTFEGTAQDTKAIVIKPAVHLDKDTIKIRAMVKQRQVDYKKDGSDLAHV